MVPKGYALLAAARDINAAVQSSKLRMPATPQAAGEHESPLSTYLRTVDDPYLRGATKKLFEDGHYARAVEEAFKCLNNFIKQRCGIWSDGAGLMRTAFSPDKPILKLNRLKTVSQKDEQQGYMHILAGCMTGIRNPRAHEHNLQDSAESALEMLGWANHLMKKVKGATKTRKRAK